MRRTPSLSVDRFLVSRDDSGTMPMSASPMKRQAEAGVARARPPQRLQRVADRTGDAEPQSGSGRIGRRHDDPVANPRRARRRIRPGDAAADRLELLLVVVGLRVEPAVLADRERNLAAIAPRRREDRREQVRQVDLGVRRAHDLAVTLERDVEARARQRHLAARRRLAHAQRPERRRRTGAARVAPWPLATAACTFSSATRCASATRFCASAAPS